MAHQLQIWGLRDNSPTKEGLLLTTINFWATDTGIQYFTLIATADVEKAGFAVNTAFTVETLNLGALVPAGTPWSQPADKAKRTPAKSGVTKSPRQRITFSGVSNIDHNAPAPAGLSTL